MPWMILSHPAPALVLKVCRPTAFSGLALVLGTIAPDLAFILRLDTESVVAHTFVGQLSATVPLVLVLHALATFLVLPWLVPRLPAGPPLYLEELAGVRTARTVRDWARVAVSAWIGGTSHVLLDGVTHGDHAGWAVVFLPALRAPWPLPGGAMVPLHDVLHAALSVVLGAAALVSWRRLARTRQLWAWRGEAPRPLPPVSSGEPRRLVALLATFALAGAVTGPVFSGASDAPVAELAAYGALAFVAYGVVLLAAGHGLRRWQARREESGRDHVT
jgi:hypothetical protein